MLPVNNPRSGNSDYQIPDHDHEWVSARAKELRDAQTHWNHAGLQHRCEVLRQWTAEIKLRHNEIADALSIDTGRFLMAHLETTGVEQRINYWLERAPQLVNDVQSGQSGLVPSVSFQHQMVPYPVVGIISPWNVPLLLALIDAIPALLAGSAVLLKPSEVTPRFAEPLAASIAAIPELAGVLKIVTGGAQTGIALIDEVDAICFTGSVDTGRKVAAQAAHNFIPAFLELGGKDPAIVLPSANLQNAATAILRSAAGLSGQTCQSLERIYVHASVFDEFLELLVDQAKAITFNWPDIHQGELGPFIFPQQADKVREQIADAVAHGANVRCGGKVSNLDGGMYCLPTVLTEIDQNMKIMRQETFGPLLPVMKFTTTEEAIELANDSQFGLSAAVFAGTREEGEAVARQIVAGAVSINDASLTGVVHDVEKNAFCLSGMGGSRMGDAGLLRFFRKQALLFQTEPAAPLSNLNEANATNIVKP